MSGPQQWAEQRVTADDDEFFTDEFFTAGTPGLFASSMTGGDNAVNSYIVGGMQFFLQEWFCGPIEGLEGSFNHGQMSTPKSVPEPASMVLLATGALGAFAARKRKQAADAK